MSRRPSQPTGRQVLGMIALIFAIGLVLGFVLGRTL